jgi:hypothetical protein
VLGCRARGVRGAWARRVCFAYETSSPAIHARPVGRDRCRTISVTPGGGPGRRQIERAVVIALRFSSQLVGSLVAAFVALRSSGTDRRGRLVCRLFAIARRLCRDTRMRSSRRPGRRDHARGEPLVRPLARCRLPRRHSDRAVRGVSSVEAIARALHVSGQLAIHFAPPVQSGRDARASTLIPLQTRREPSRGPRPRSRTPAWSGNPSPRAAAQRACRGRGSEVDRPLREKEHSRGCRRTRGRRYRLPCDRRGRPDPGSTRARRWRRSASGVPCRPQSRGL